MSQGTLQGMLLPEYLISQSLTQWIVIISALVKKKAATTSG